jgi:Na+-transporting NADH:ubiquinone oxidoreductase subunit A
MAKMIRLKKGLDLPLAGKASCAVSSMSVVDCFSVTPTDYHGLVPKVMVKAGDVVLAGSPVLYDKNHPEVRFVSPVSGMVQEVVRGEKRKLLNILIIPDGRNEYLTFPVENPLEMTPESVVGRLCESGLWPYIKQRPYDVIANPSQKPKAIFVTGFDSAPLAPDYDFLLKGQGSDFQTGLDALTCLTDGKVHLGLSAAHACSELSAARNVEITVFSGPHPAGNVGVQINHIDPVNRGEVVWTLRAPDVLFIGRLFRKGVVDLSRMVAVCGPCVHRAEYIQTLPGASLKALLSGNLHDEVLLRIINGNPLTGTKTSMDGFLSAEATSVTVLKEGTGEFELFGWAMPRLHQFSFSKTYFSGWMEKIFPNRVYEPDARVLGGQRTLIMSGEYDKVFPMDILPEQLVRACSTGILEKMENLGLYEVAPEDFALCEYICTSKVEVQKVIREALDLLRKENGDS